MRGRVVLFKASSESDKDEGDSYENLFTSNGFQVSTISTLEFQFCNLESLLSKLNNPDDYSGVILSSPRCVQALQLAVEGDSGKSILGRWSRLVNFVVGEVTAQAVDALGLLHQGKQSGNASALADVIAQVEYKKPFLYPMGSLTSETLKQKLALSGIETDNCMVYETKAHPALRANMAPLAEDVNTLSSASPILVYFSPSGVHFTLPLFKEFGCNLTSFKFVAIGPTTAKCLLEYNMHVDGVANKPNPASLLEAVCYVHSS